MTILRNAISYIGKRTCLIRPVPARPDCFGAYVGGQTAAERECMECAFMPECVARTAATPGKDPARWDRHFLRIAAECASMSKDPSTRVGAVAVRDRRILATGYNGLPTGMPDDPAVLNDRERKYRHIVHAEQNIVAWAAREGVSLSGATLYVTPLAPCADCAKLLAQAGLVEVVYPEGEAPDRWREHFAAAEYTLRVCGITVRSV